MDRVKKNRNNIIIDIFAIFYIILPSYFALEINTSFPLMTASRFFLFLLLMYYVLKTRGRLSMKIVDNRRFSNDLAVYIILALIPNLFHLTETSESIKRMFVIVVEELMLIWLISRCVCTKGKIIRFLRLMIYASAVVALISIVGSIVGLNFFSFLNTVERKVAIADFSRLGLLRAEAGFGHAVFYSLYCAVLMPIIFYFIEEERKLRYTIILLLDILALLFSNSRGAFLAVLIISVLWFRRNINTLINKYSMFVVILIISIVFGILIMPEIILKFAQSIGALFTALVGAETKIENYGFNASGAYSRLYQFSGMYHVLINNPLFGMGAKADGRGLIKYKNEHGWYTTDTYDVGFVQIFCDYGIVGFIGSLCLIRGICMLIKTLDKRDKLTKLFIYVFVTYLICFLSSVGVDKLFWVLVGLLISYSNCSSKRWNNV